MDAKSASNFTVELPNAVQMPENTVFFVTDVCIPHVWKTIEGGFNDKLYLFTHTPSGPLPAQLAVANDQFTVITIPEGNYTLSELATRLSQVLNDALNSTARQFTTFAVTPHATNFSITAPVALSGSSSSLIGR